MTFFEWVFSSILNQLNRIEGKVDSIMVSFQEAKQNWVDYANELKAQRDAAVSALEQAQTTAQAAAEALQDFQDNDAVTDAQQLADQAQQFADELSTALNEVKDPPQEPEPLPDEPTEEPPAEEQPAE